MKNEILLLVYAYDVSSYDFSADISLFVKFQVKTNLIDEFNDENFGPTKTNKKFTKNIKR